MRLVMTQACARSACATTLGPSRPTSFFGATATLLGLAAAGITNKNGECTCTCMLFSLGITRCSVSAVTLPNLIQKMLDVDRDCPRACALAVPI